MPRTDVRLKRAYEDPSPADGHRVLVDRLWPRGLARERARIDEWAKDLAPSDELRRWFGHDPERFPEFARRYLTELGERRAELARLRKRARQATVTLVFGARDEQRNNAVVLARALRSGLPRG